MSTSYTATVVSFDPDPVISYQDGLSAFVQAFNPSWVEASESTGGAAGLLVRVQNCSAAAAGVCDACYGQGKQASKIAFARFIDDLSHPRFSKIDDASLVYMPHDATDDYGTEDPRILRDPATGLYYMFYTCFNSGHAAVPRISLCLATTRNPTVRGGWERHGYVGLGENSKSGALLMGNDRREHLLFWGAGTIHLSRSTNLSSWPAGEPFLTKTSWGNPHVESGPPPMPLSTGDFIFFINSWSATFPDAPGYQPAWVVLSGSDPTKVVAHADKALWNPQRAAWMEGSAPALCNVPNVAFLEAAHPTGRKDEFRVYFGGADAVVGSAVVRIDSREIR